MGEIKSGLHVNMMFNMQVAAKRKSVHLCIERRIHPEGI